MAQFDESKVINAFHSEKAEVGKRYFFADKLSQLKSRVEADQKIAVLKSIGAKDCPYPFVVDANCMWELIYPYEEPPTQEEILLDRIRALQITNGSLTDKVNELTEKLEKIEAIILEMKEE